MVNTPQNDSLNKQNKVESNQKIIPVSEKDILARQEAHKDISNEIKTEKNNQSKKVDKLKMELSKNEGNKEIPQDQDGNFNKLMQLHEKGLDLEKQMDNIKGRIQKLKDEGANEMNTSRRGDSPKYPEKKALLQVMERELKNLSGKFSERTEEWFSFLDSMPKEDSDNLMRRFHKEEAIKRAKELLGEKYGFETEEYKQKIKSYIDNYDIKEDLLVE